MVLALFLINTAVLNELSFTHSTVVAICLLFETDGSVRRAPHHTKKGSRNCLAFGTVLQKVPDDPILLWQPER